MRGTCMLAMSALALTAGCGKGADPGPPSEGHSTIPLDPPVVPPPTPPDPAARCDALTVRLRGSGAPPGQTVRLGVSGVKLIQGGSALETRFVASGDVVFPVAGAYRLAVVPVPSPDQEIGIQVSITGGQVCDAERCTALAPCGAPLIAGFDPAKVRTDSCHVVLDLDLARSIQTVRGGPETLLHYRLGY